MQSSVNSAHVSLSQPNELGAIFREGMKENPIDLGDESDDKKMKQQPKSRVDGDL